MEDFTKITQDQTIATQIISKVLQGNSHGVTINVISIGTITMHNGDRDEKMSKTGDNRVQLAGRKRHSATTKGDLVKALIDAQWVVKDAAKILTLPHSTVRNKISNLGGVHKLREESE